MEISDNELKLGTIIMAAAICIGALIIDGDAGTAVALAMSNAFVGAMMYYFGTTRVSNNDNQKEKVKV